MVEVVAGGSAFAALRGDGEVITWGHCRWGGDSNQVADELRPAKVAVEKIWGGLMCDGAMEIWVVSWVVRCFYDMLLVGKKTLKIMFV